MLHLKHPFSLWMQISSLSFCMAGNFSDLLIIRLCLSTAYVFLFINSALGAPLWPALRFPTMLQLDGVLWAVLNLYVHVSTVVRLLQDEQEVVLDEDHEALWRMFYRTGGLSRKLFKHTIGEYCGVVTYKQGEFISTKEHFYVIYKGTVHVTVADSHGKLVSSRQARSGQLFDFRDLGLLQDLHSLEQHRLDKIVALTDVTLFCFPKHQMAQIASHPTTRLMWKELLMENLLKIVQRYFDKRIRNIPDRPQEHYVNPMFLPLQSWEEPDPLRAGSGKALRYPLNHIIATMQRSFTPPWPWKGPILGLRHLQLPAPTRSAYDADMRKRLLEKNERTAFLGAATDAKSRTGKYEQYSSVSSRIEEDQEFLEYLHEIDEEIGGLNLIAFK